MKNNLYEVMFIICLSLGILFIGNGHASALAIYYDFEGSCISGVGGGCGGFGLSDGDSVTGVFSFEETVIVPDDVFLLDPLSQVWDTTITFGDSTFTKGDLTTFFPQFVQFSLPDALSLEYPSGFIGFSLSAAPGLFTDSFLLDPTTGSDRYTVRASKGIIDETTNIMTVTSQASALAEWTRRSAPPIPEPSTFLLLGGGLSGLAFMVRRKKKS